MYNLLFDDQKQKEMENFFLKDLAKDGYIQNHPRKSFINSESADCIYIIMSGECRQVMYGPNGKKVSYFRLTQGNIFGEMDYFDRRKTCVKTECSTDVKVSVVYRDILEKRLKEDPSIYKYFLHSEARKYRILMLKIAEEKFNLVIGQLSAFLYRLSVLSEDLNKEKIQFVLTHQEIADRIGCSRISVTNNMNCLIEKGIVEYKERYLIIKDKEKLISLINLF